jgi:hypothetical protein
VSYHDKSAAKTKCLAAQQHAQSLITLTVAQRLDSFGFVRASATQNKQPAQDLINFPLHGDGIRLSARIGNEKWSNRQHSADQPTKYAMAHDLARLLLLSLRSSLAEL